MAFKRGIEEVEAESGVPKKGVIKSSKQPAQSKRQRLLPPSQTTQQSTDANSQIPLPKSVLHGMQTNAELYLNQNTLSTGGENDEQNANTADPSVDKIIFISALGLSPKIINEDPARTRFRRARERRRRKATKLSLLPKSNSLSPEMIWNSIMKKEQFELDQNKQVYPEDKFGYLRSSESKKIKPTSTTSAVRKPRKIPKHENALALPKSSSLPRRSAPLSAINSPIKLEFPETSLHSTARRGRPRKFGNVDVQKFDTSATPATVTLPVVSENELPPPSLQKPKGRPRKGMERMPLVRTPGSRTSSRLKGGEVCGNTIVEGSQRIKGRPRKVWGRKMSSIRASCRLLNQNIGTSPPRKSKLMAENKMKLARYENAIRTKNVSRSKPKPAESKLDTPKKPSNLLSAAAISDVLNQFGKVIVPPVVESMIPFLKPRGRPKKSVQISNSTDSDRSSHLTTKPTPKPFQKKPRIEIAPKSVDNRQNVPNVPPEASPMIEPAEPLHQPKPPPKKRNRPKNLALARLFMGPPNQKRTRNHLKK